MWRRFCSLLLLCVSVANLSGRLGGDPERPFVRATSLLHSHFCNTETLQEAIIRSVWQGRAGGGWGGGGLSFHGSSSRSRGLGMDLSVHHVYHHIPNKCSSFTCADHTPSLTSTGKQNLSIAASLLRHSALFLLHVIILFTWNVNVRDIFTAGVPALLSMEPAAWPRRLTSCSTGDHWGTRASQTTRTALSPCQARLDTDYWNTGLTCSDTTATRRLLSVFIRGEVFS